MNEHDIRRIIKEEIQIALQIITSGSAGANTATTEDINALFPGMPTLVGRPIARPYGFLSRAPKNTISVTAQQGHHPGNKLTIGHRDANPPTTVGEGETAIYSLGGYIVKCEGTDIKVGKGNDLETMVVGDTLKTFLVALLTHIIAHKHIDALGVDTSPPINFADFQSDQEAFLDNEKILAKDGGRY